MPRTHYWIEMGQGLVTDISKVGISSGTFYSCSAIIFYGSHRPKRCGYYHFPSGGLSGSHKNMVAYTLRGMRLQTSATTIVMVKADDGGLVGQGTPSSDVYELREFFDGVTFRTNDEDTPAAVYLDNDGIYVHNPDGWPSVVSLSGGVGSLRITGNHLAGANIIDGYGSRLLGADMENLDIGDLGIPAPRETAKPKGLKALWAKLKGG